MNFNFLSKLTGREKPVQNNPEAPVAAEGENVNLENIETEETPESEKTPESNAFVAREHIEKIKIKEGGIKNAEYRDLEYTKDHLREQIEALSDYLLATREECQANRMLFNDFDDGLSSIAARTGLSEEEIYKIYYQNQDNLEAKAKAEINQSTSLKAKIAKTALKSGLYIGAGILAGTSTAATLGLGAGVGVSVIAGARVVDRFITEKISRKKLDAKVEEIKKRKTADDKEAIKERLAAAVSLKKKLEIEGVNLYETREDLTRSEVIDEYIDEQEKAGTLGVAPEEVAGYKEKMKRMIIGLDTIDRVNAVQEEKLNQTTWLDKIQSLENKLSGETVEKKTISSAALIGAGLAARHIPGVRQALAAYAGWKIGGAVSDYFIDKQEGEITAARERKIAAGITDINGYRLARLKLLDHKFREKSPQEYLKLKEAVTAKEEEILNSGAKGEAGLLNDELEDAVRLSRGEKKINKSVKLASRAAGALAGVMVGEGIKEIGEHFRSAQAPAEMPVKAPVEAPLATASAETASVEAPSTEVTSVETPVVEKASVEELPADLNHKYPESFKNFSEAAPRLEPVPARFEDEISNAGLKPGQHDSVWRSTEQIFKGHAAELGYQGDINDEAALDKWAAAETVKTINNSGDISDKVFEGNRVVLEKDDAGDYHVSVEQGGGATPGHLPEAAELPGAGHTLESDRTVQHAAEQIFRDHAAKLGYQGDIKDKVALDKWVAIETEKAIHNSTDYITADKIYGDDTLVLEQDSDGVCHLMVASRGSGTAIADASEILRNQAVESSAVSAEAFNPETLPSQFLDYFGLDPAQLHDLTPGQNKNLVEMLDAWDSHVEYIQNESDKLFQEGFAGQGDKFLAHVQSVKGSKLTEQETGFWRNILASCSKGSVGSVSQELLKQKIEAGLEDMILPKY